MFAELKKEIEEMNKWEMLERRFFYEKYKKVF